MRSSLAYEYAQCVCVCLFPADQSHRLEKRARDSTIPTCDLSLTGWTGPGSGERHLLRKDPGPSAALDRRSQIRLTPNKKSKTKDEKEHWQRCWEVMVVRCRHTTETSSMRGHDNGQSALGIFLGGQIETAELERIQINHLPFRQSSICASDAASNPLFLPSMPSKTPHPLTPTASPPHKPARICISPPTPRTPHSPLPSCGPQP